VIDLVPKKQQFKLFTADFATVKLKYVDSSAVDVVNHRQLLHVPQSLDLLDYFVAYERNMS